MSERKTHQYVPCPRIGARYLADYMAASERAKRRIISDSKFRPIARVIQHSEAISTVSLCIHNRSYDLAWLHTKAAELRNRLADDDFERDMFDHNAAYIEQFAAVVPSSKFPRNAQMLPPGPSVSIDVFGVLVTLGLHLRLARTTKTNKAEEGAAAFRYAKGKPLSAEAAAYQSSFMLCYLRDISIEKTVIPNAKLCLTIDAYTGVCHPAPSNAHSRYQNMQAACQSISERWPNVEPPPGAIF
jgi:hypothetical protein